MKPLMKFSLILGLVFTLLPSTLDARDQVDSSERLRLLNEATGNTQAGTQSSFQARLDAMLSTTASAERSYVAAQDADAREKANLNSNVQELEEKRIKELNPERYDALAKKDKTKIDQSKDLSSKTDGTDKGYQKIREEIQGEFDKRITEKKPVAAASPSEPSLSDSAVMAAALKNNPFYKGDSVSKERESFDARKPLLISRLVQHGLGEGSAIDYVGRASSDEELILLLVRANELSYGEASEVVS